MHTLVGGGGLHEGFNALDYRKNMHGDVGKLGICHIIWNPDHLDRIGQTCTYVSEHGTDMYVHVYTCA